jgi:uncharacterized protein YaiE (UPF0345 family)
LPVGEYRDRPRTEDPDQSVLCLPHHVGGRGELTTMVVRSVRCSGQQTGVGWRCQYVGPGSRASWSMFGDEPPEEMSVLVRYHKTELEVEADYQTFACADAFAVHGDNTLELLRESEVIGFVHPERWDSVCTTEDAAQAV